jgi:hypothetical protein
MMALSDLIIRQAKAAEKDYNLPDADGLGLVVTSTGGKARSRFSARRTIRAIWTSIRLPKASLMRPRYRSGM